MYRWMSLALVGTACYQPAATVSCEVQCGAGDARCPSGFVCESGRCRDPLVHATCGIVPPDRDGGLDAPGDPLDAAPDALQPPNACPSSYGLVANSGRRIRFNSTRLTWAAAAEACAADLSGGPMFTHLAVITSDLEASEISAVTSNQTGWIGLSDRRTASSFLWVTAEPTSYPPATGAPWGDNQPGTAGDCVSMTLASFFTQDCGLTMPSYCECDEHANDPARYTPMP